MKRDEKIELRVRKDIKEDIKRFASQRGVTMTEFINVVLINHIQEVIEDEEFNDKLFPDYNKNEL